MKTFNIRSAVFVIMLSISSCTKQDQPAPVLNGTYIGMSTPAGSAAYPDTVTIYSNAPYTQASVTRNFHSSNHYYTFYLPASVNGTNLVIADTTIYFSPSPTIYSTKGSLTNDSVLTLNDVFNYQGGSTGSSTFVGTLH